MAGLNGTKTQEDIKKNEENKKKKIEEKKNSTTQKTKSGWEKFLEGGRADENDPNLIMSTGSGASIMEDDTHKKEEPKEEPKKEQSLVANQFGEKKGKTWNDVLAENGNDPEKIKDWLNNNPDYKAGDRTKKGMSEFGYIQDEDGKWVPKTKTTTDTAPSSDATFEDTLKRLEELSKENEDLRKQIESFTNKDGSANEQKTLNAMSQYEQKLAEMGVGYFDEDGKFVFKDTTKKGWEDWATMLSVGASVIGLAMGVPIVPINFRKITNKDEKDAKIREFQKQYTDMMAGNAAKVKDAESSKEAGDYIKKNQESIDTFVNYADKTASYKAKSDIDTDSEKELIDKNVEAEMTLAQAAFEREVKKMEISHQQQKDLQILMSNLSTESAIKLLNQKQYKWLLDAAKEAEAAGLDNRAIALNLQAWSGNTATTQNLKHAESIVDMITDILNSGSKYMPGNGGKGD